LHEVPHEIGKYNIISFQSIRCLLKRSQQQGCPASVWGLRQVLRAARLKQPSLRSRGKSLSDCRLWPI